MNGSTLVLPANGELEITLFGSGYGESIVVHIGNGNWLIVDSSIDRETNKPAALRYLESIGVDVANKVTGVIITHWHDDHIRGISEIAEKCLVAKFYISAALMCSKDSQKFKTLVLDSSISRLANLNADSNSGISEFQKLFEILRARNNRPGYALQDQILIDIQGNQVWALAPHSSVFEKAIEAIIAQIPDENGFIQRLKSPTPNHTSVVLWLKFGEVRALLGADLEECAEHQGWSLIVSEKKDSIIDRKAEAFKVAHHGSVTGHHIPVWNELLAENPLCLIAPFSRNPKLPTSEDVARIGSYSSSVYVTSPFVKDTEYKGSDDKHVKRKLAQKEATYVHQAYSYIRIRKALGQDWQIEMHGNACHLSSIQAAA